MEFNKIKAELKNKELDVTRIDNENYFEVVIKKAYLDEIIPVLEGVLGQKAWPSRNKLSKEIEKLIKNFGGLRKGQTLYCLVKESVSIFAMLWPWQDGERITIKVAKV